MKIQKITPELKRGWAAMDKDGDWNWFRKKPKINKKLEIWSLTRSEQPFCHFCLTSLMQIDRFDGDWKDSLIKCGEKK